MMKIRWNNVWDVSYNWWEAFIRVIEVYIKKRRPETAELCKVGNEMTILKDDIEITDYWGGWFVGFTDGEGCFTINKRNHENSCINYRCRFQITLRDDDRAILEEIRDILGIGRISDCLASTHGNVHHRPTTEFYVNAIADCAKLVEIFERYPLRAKKQRDYSIWRCAVVELQKPVSYRNAKLLEYYFQEIKRVRKYDKQPELEKPMIVESQLMIDF